MTGKARDNKGFFSNDRNYDYLDEKDEDLQDDNFLMDPNRRIEPEFEMSEGGSPQKDSELGDDLLNEFW